MKIVKLEPRQILNSAGSWTLECLLKTAANKEVTASVPKGISTGSAEQAPVAIKKAIEQIEKDILPRVINKDLDQEKLDQLLTQGGWGSNATLAVSAAFFKLEEIKTDYHPKMMMLIFEGEKHGNRQLTIQEFMIIVDQIEEGVNFYHNAEKKLAEQGIITTVGSEGGFSPGEFTDEKILEFIKDLGGTKVALDIAGNVNPPSVTELLDIVRRYPIISLEDPFPEKDINQWQEFLTKALAINPNLLVVADDLTVTDSKKIKDGFKNNLFNGVIIKPNQQGTITAAKEALLTAKELGIKTIVSHRGEETNDDWIVDFALKYQSDFVKFGAPSRGERVAKYNRLLNP